MNDHSIHSIPGEEGSEKDNTSIEQHDPQVPAREMDIAVAHPAPDSIYPSWSQVTRVAFACASDRVPRVVETLWIRCASNQTDQLIRNYIRDCGNYNSNVYLIYRVTQGSRNSVAHIRVGWKAVVVVVEGEY